MSDLGDDQQVAEATDEDELGEDLSEFPPDRGLASREAAFVTDTGDVPVDSVAERDWREDRGDDPEPGDHVQLLDEEWGDPAGDEEPDEDGELLGEAVDGEAALLPAEEDAIHLEDEP